MHFTRFFIGILALLSTCGSLKAQTVLSVELQQELSLQLLEIILSVASPDYGVDAYKVIYTGEDPFGETDTLSGLMVIPQDTDNSQFPMLAYMHGTAFSKDAVPSTLGVDERQLVVAFASNGYIAVAPDYLGYGVDSLEIHPYVHADTEAKAGRDMLLAVRGWLDEQEIAYNDQVFATGYSQGGHASAALQKLVEADADSELTITAAAHLSGPYAISEAMRQAIIDPQLTTFPVYVVFTYLGYNYVYDLYDDNAAIFVEPYLSSIDSFVQNQIDLAELNESLFDMLASNGEELDGMFQDSIVDILLEGDPSHPILVALRDNDLFDFVPQAPTRLYYCTEDEQVPFQNALLADSVMNALGAEDVASVNGGPEDHGGCVIPAALFGLGFFNTFQEILSSDREVSFDPKWDLSPNPVSATGTIRLIVNEAPPTDFELYDLQGRRLAVGPVPVDMEISLQGLAAGTYAVKLRRGTQFTVKRIIVR